MQYVQVGEIGKAVLITSQSELPAPSALYEGKYYFVNIRYSDPYTVRCVKGDNGAYSWQKVSELPALSNGISSGDQLEKGIQAIDANGKKVTGTMEFAEKTIKANGVYVSSEDNVRGYSKVTVDIAGETAENPYIVTTEAEMRAYLAEEHVGSFVKYKTSLYFDQANSTPLNCRSKTELTGAIDTGLGPAYTNMKIDEWLPEAGMVKIASIETFNHDTKFRELSQPYSVRETYDLYAWKYKNTDGSYTRVLFYVWAEIWCFEYTPTDTSSWGNNGVAGLAFYQDNMTSEANTALGQLSISVTVGDYTGTTDVSAAPDEYKDYVKLGFFSYAVPNTRNFTDYKGKYSSDDSGGGGIAGVAQLSWATYQQVYWNSVTYPRCTYLYKDASVLLGGIQWSYNQKLESDKTYRDGFVYIVNSKKATRNKWQAESPLVQGDQLAGATLYFNQQITLKEFDDLCNSMIADSETDGGTYFLYNVTNPYTSENISELISNSCPLIVVHDGGLISYLNYTEGYELVNPIQVNDTITTLYFNHDIDPDFTKFDWSQAEIIDGTGKLLTLIEGTTPQYSNNDRLQVGMIPAGTVLEGHTFANDNYVITAGTGGEAVYLTEEYAQLLGSSSGWLSSYLSIESTTITSVSQQDIWGEYVSKDGEWINLAENIFLFEDYNDDTTIKFASVVAPSSITVGGETIAIPATVGKVNKPDISNAVIGKTANFTKTIEEYSIYYFTQEVVPGNVFIASSTSQMNALLGDETTNNEIAKNRVYLFAGQDGKYVQGTFYQLSNGSLHILPPLDVEDTALIPVYFETQEGWFHSPSGTSVKQLIQLISRGTYANAPAAPSVSIGKSFDAWYTQPAGGTEWNFSTAINEPTILYAQYI